MSNLDDGNTTNQKTFKMYDDDFYTWWTREGESRSKSKLNLTEKNLSTVRELCRTAWLNGALKSSDNN